MQEGEALTIEQLAERVGVTVRTVRFYISDGLLPGPEGRGKAASHGDEHLLRLQNWVLAKKRSSMGSQSDATAERAEKPPKARVWAVFHGPGPARRQRARPPSSKGWCLVRPPRATHQPLFLVRSWRFSQILATWPGTGLTSGRVRWPRVGAMLRLEIIIPIYGSERCAWSAPQKEARNGGK